MDPMLFLTISIPVAGAILLVAGLVALLRKPSEPFISIKPPHERAGERGERAASALLRKYLAEDDTLLTNVCIEYDGKPAELDNVIVNKYGVFVIEVKNYVGELYGSEDDYEWTKVKTTDAGNKYEKTVKNPIKQVKRQVYLLAGYLGERGIKVWVQGYALLLNDNSPVESEWVLSTASNMRNVFHASDRQRLSKQTEQLIVDALSEE